MGLPVERPDQLWVADITYIKLGGEFVYLAVVMDMFSRSVRGWQLGRSMEGDLTLIALYDSSAKKSKRPVRTVLEMLHEAELEEAIAAYHARVAANSQWAVYVVRRVFKAAILPSAKAIAVVRSKGRAARPTYPTPPRQVKKLFVGSKEEAHEYLHALAQAYGKAPQMVALSERFWSIPRPRDESKRPFVEEMFVAVFVEARDKQNERIDFEALWQGMTGQPTGVKPPLGENATIE